MTKHKENILRLRSEGKTYKEIQNELGCSKGTISYHVGEGQKDKTIGRTRDKRGEIKKYIQKYKQEHPCVDCGENYPYWIMEFDHLKDKKFNLSGFYVKTAKLETVKKEIEKCEVVCSNCHKNRTYMRSYRNGSNSLDVSMYYDI
jgi:predicted transcriptional regulator